MSVAAETLAALEHAFAGRRAPRVRALHLPLASSAGKDAEFGALELDDGSLGLCYLLLDGTRDALAAGDAANHLAGTDARALARTWVTGTGPQRALGFAAVNALTRHLFDRAGFLPAEAPDSIGGLDPQPGEHVGMVGFFPPLVKQVTARGARLTVVELRAELAGERAGFRVTLDPRELRTCDKVLTTSTVLLNDTLDEILSHCMRARAIAMIGPGAGCLPDALFARGVTTLGGAWIVDAAGVKRALATGERWGAFARKFALAHDAYPGIAALLRRAG
jgi:hypothetical protein